MAVGKHIANGVVMANAVFAPDLIRMREQNRKIAMLTAYDQLSAVLAERAGTDVILVGDSLGTVIQGLDTTIPVTLDEVVYHARIVSRCTERVLVIGDLPFMTYQASVEQATNSAGRLVKEAGVGAVKLEGGSAVVPQVKAIVQVGIPVMGHLGLTPQSYFAMGGHKVQAKQEAAQERLLADALQLQEAGVFALVLEGIPEELGKRVTASLSIPTIGIGAGRYCSGQVLVFHDVLGLTPPEAKRPKFVKQYAELFETAQSALSRYCEDVRSGDFPTSEQVYTIPAKRELRSVGK